MKVSNVSGKYVIEIENKKVLVEDVKDANGKRYLVFTTVSSYQLPDGNKWEVDTKDAKELKRDELPPDIKKAINMILKVL
ncbi:MAG: hypothetical protein OWQ54_01060 [Sulfolobaceae archaeon]|nr:hypothetical protein [Sulfolobaceae archaeon]